ncbi:MAG: hypothetical protein ACRD0U_15875 [Acidimicrobiales bacterium]
MTVTVDAWAAVVGQDRAVGDLRAAVDKPVHAYLLEGPAGSGKRAVARAFAAELLAGARSRPGRDRHVSLALAEHHPDLHVFERTGPYITVEQARDIIAEASRAPIEGDRKVLVLVDFHLVERAGPALLKVIEEPSASTVFVVLAEHVPPALVPIASRCVRIRLDRVPDALVAARLEVEGVEPALAAEVAVAAAGNLDRARLLATDPRLPLRREAWRAAPRRLNGSGAAVAAVVAELRAQMDDAQAPLEERHRLELAAVDEETERYGQRRGSGRKGLVERHKREVRRLRTDELRFGLATLAARYRDELRAETPKTRAVVVAVSAIQDAAEDLLHNPNETLLLQSLLLRLPRLTA